ncbi:MAG: cytochrome c-type bioproteinis protein [Rhodospirillaceae bacterium]|nr:MAG: cytochrome c-type bioproteinis protein [Rhodospirillaceae bacterium]
MEPLQISYAAALGGGVLAFLSPCILPLVPAYLCFISGFSLEQITADDRPAAHRWEGFLAGSLLVLGLGTVFVALGAAASSIGQILAGFRDWLAGIGGVLIIGFGLHYMGVFRLVFLDVERRLHLESRPAGLLGAFLVGLAFGFGWTPCVGPILGSILMIAGSGDSMRYGVSLLAVFAAGLGVCPFWSPDGWPARSCAFSPVFAIRSTRWNGSWVFCWW